MNSLQLAFRGMLCRYLELAWAAMQEVEFMSQIWPDQLRQGSLELLLRRHSFAVFLKMHVLVSRPSQGQETSVQLATAIALLS